jgi:deazaflavin-dependent oxidoreductase (nitroreductase family)
LDIEMSRGDRRRRAAVMVFWRLTNPFARRLAFLMPWLVVLETTGRRSGKPRRTPLARGPIEGDVAWLIAVHGRHSTWVRNLESSPQVRLQVGLRWRTGTASLLPLDPQALERFNFYARSGPRTLGIDPLLVRVDLDPQRGYGSVGSKVGDSDGRSGVEPEA